MFYKTDLIQHSLCLGRILDLKVGKYALHCVLGKLCFRCAGCRQPLCSCFDILILSYLLLRKIQHSEELERIVWVHQVEDDHCREQSCTIVTHVSLEEFCWMNLLNKLKKTIFQIATIRLKRTNPQF